MAFAGAPYVVSAALIVAIAVVAGRPLRGESTAGVGVGSRRAILMGAAVLAVFGGVVEWRVGALAARDPSGEELLSTFPGLLSWLLMVPLLAVGAAISAVSARQLLRGRVRGGAGWIGVAALLVVLGLQEAGRRVWVAADSSRVHVRSGLLLPRELSSPVGDVESVLVVESLSRGSPAFTLSLAGERLPGALATTQVRFGNGEAARAEASRWAALLGCRVREEKIGE